MATAKKTPKKKTAKKKTSTKKTATKATGAKSTGKKAPAKKASAKKTPAKKTAAKKAAPKPEAAAPAPAPAKPTPEAGKKPARSGPSSLDVNMGHVFALRPRVATSFRPDDFRAARQALSDESFDDIAAAARAVAERALELTHGGAGPGRRGRTPHRW